MGGGWGGLRDERRGSHYLKHSMPRRRGAPVQATVLDASSSRNSCRSERSHRGEHRGGIMGAASPETPRYFRASFLCASVARLSVFRVVRCYTGTPHAWTATIALGLHFPPLIASLGYLGLVSWGSICLQERVTLHALYTRPGACMRVRRDTDSAPSYASRYLDSVALVWYTRRLSPGRVTMRKRKTINPEFLRLTRAEIRSKRHIPSHPAGVCVDCDAVRAERRAEQAERDKKFQEWAASPHVFSQSGRFRRCMCGQLLRHQIHIEDTAWIHKPHAFVKGLTKFRCTCGKLYRHRIHQPPIALADLK